IYLSNYALINVRDELLRLSGVSDVNVLGERDYSIRVWLDPRKLAACNMTAIDVSNAIRNQNIDAPAGQVGQPPAARGQPFQFPIDTLGRLTTPEEFGDIIVKVGSNRTTSANSLAQAPPSPGMPMPGAGIPALPSTPTPSSSSSTDSSTSTGTSGSSSTSS